MSRQLEWVRDDWVRRASFVKIDFKRFIYKSIYRDKSVNIYSRGVLSSRISKASTHFSITEQRNRCRLCGRSHFVLSKAGLSRMQFKFLAGCGLIKGVARHGK